jgi:hypothetical protein
VRAGNDANNPNSNNSMEEVEDVSDSDNWEVAGDRTADAEVKDLLEAGHGFRVMQVFHVFGRTSTERRVSKRVHEVRWALEFRTGDLTMAQKQALAMVYGCVIPPAKCARLLGISRQAFRQRLVGAEEAVDRLWDEGGRRRWKKGRPDAVLHAPEGAAEMVEQAKQVFWQGAEYIYGDEPLWRQDSGESQD